MAGPAVEIVGRDLVIPLRWAVLRPGLPVEAAHFPEDDGPAVHLAAESRRDPGEPDREQGGVIVAIGSIYPEPSPVEAVEPAWRLRGMATDPGARGRGFGTAVLRRAIEIVSDRGARLLWCNARTPAVGFYEHHGLAVHGDEFDTEVGPHFYMSLAL